jgi:putative Holliday junction resolvase
MTPGRIVALDVGDVRIGIAVSDEMRLIATPHSVYKRVGYGPDVRHIKALCDQMGTTSVLCGLPRNMDGSYGPACDKVRAFAELVLDGWQGEHDFYDERLSTMAAERFLYEAELKWQKRRKVVDKIAAQVILEGYMTLHPVK